MLSGDGLVPFFALGRRSPHLSYPSVCRSCDCAKLFIFLKSQGRQGVEDHRVRIYKKSDRRLAEGMRTQNTAQRSASPCSQSP